ncbi:hypothetical protein BH11ACT4_BH11ACT4_04370 [soil metagenome]
MTDKTLGRPGPLARAYHRLDYFAYRVRNLKPGSVVERARQVARRHNKSTALVLADMLAWSTFHDTGFQDYVDWDFAILTSAERSTFMTNAYSNHLAVRFNDPAYRHLFENKIHFNREFAPDLHRAWLDVDAASTDELREFVQSHKVVMGKVPVSNSGYGVARYSAADIDDWEAFRAQLVARGQTLVEEYITNQHPDISAVCPGVVNTTRVTTFFDGTDVHVLSFAQKFGMGDSASDQQAFGGVFTLLDETGHSLGPGYGSHQHIYPTHPETGASIVDFQLPMTAEVLALADTVSRRVPQIPYVGWDIVVGTDGPMLLEGNWMPGAYENKPTATGKRTGSRPLFRQVMGV